MAEAGPSVAVYSNTAAEWAPFGRGYSTACWGAREAPGEAPPHADEFDSLETVVPHMVTSMAE